MFRRSVQHVLSLAYKVLVLLGLLPLGEETMRQEAAVFVSAVTGLRAWPARGLSLLEGTAFEFWSEVLKWF